MAKIDDSVKKKVPELRFKGFTDEWEQRKLGDEVRIVMGQSPNSENYTDDPNDYILVQGNADMKNGRVLPRVWTTQVTKQAEKDDLILSVRAPVGDIGKTAYDVVIGRGVAAIKGNEFIFQNLGKMKSDGYWTRYSTGSTFESINSTDIKEAIISVPAIEEQDKIGSFFKQLDNTIALHQRKLDLLKEQKKGYLQKMFPKAGEKIPELRFKGFTDDWELRKLGDISKVIDPHPSHRAPAATEEGIPFIGIGDVNEVGNINYKTARIVDAKIFDEHHNRYDLSIPSIGIGRVASLGKVIRLRDDIGKYVVSPTMSVIQFTNNNDLDFLYSNMNTPIFQKQFKSFSNGSTRQSVGIQDLRILMVSLPVDIEEQQKIGSFFNRLDNTIALHQRKLDLLKEQKKGYLQKMFV
ncbi:restriction endonuclease subunit S [Lactococcus petauri]|uniref:restriction endonuclease subunit S n=1 Tax=Lactococcus petauri TaxID=1940789 RepID=UPI00254DB4F8|nr:restriction endonuclease subunit S [Lactococcus petauri]